jgi:hypothetical protein
MMDKVSEPLIPRVCLNEGPSAGHQFDVLLSVKKMLFGVKIKNMKEQNLN